MAWNYEGLLIALSQGVGGIIIFLIFALVSLSIGMWWYKKLPTIGEKLFPVKAAIFHVAILLLMIVIGSAVGTYRPRITAQSPRLDGTTDVIIPKVAPVTPPQAKWEKLREADTDIQTKQSWDNFPK